MFIHLSSPTAPAGKVTFIITNDSTDMKHELVGFATKTPAGAYPITGFEGDPNRIDEDTAGPVVLDTGAALHAGRHQMITVNLKPGHYALVCNLPGPLRGRDARGLLGHPAGAPRWSRPSWATPPPPRCSSTCPRRPPPPARSRFIITNDSTDMKHELVGFPTKTPAAAYPITGFEGDPNRIDEDTAGPVVLDTGAALDPGATKMSP